MKTRFGLLGMLLCCSAAIADDAVVDLSEFLGKTPALVVVVFAADEARLSTVTALVDQTPWTVFCRGTASAGLDEIRDWAAQRGVLGQRVYVVDDDGESLWLAGDMADAVWVSPRVDYSKWEKEILRVLHPGGVCVASAKIIRKHPPDGADEWRHPYHGPDNNVVSEDAVARLPGELRFQTHPVFAPMPMQSLFAGGRIFFFSGHIAFHEREEPLLNTLTVLNAYNGLKLWSRPLNPDYVVHNLAKLATESDVVFAEGETLWMLNAANGSRRGKIPAPAKIAATGDTDWKWIAQEGDKLFAAFGPPDARVAPHKQKREMGHWPWDVANDHYNSIVQNFGDARTLAAFSYPEMRLLWSESEAEPFDARTLCIRGDRIFQLAPEKYIAARDRQTGKPLWRHTPDDSQELFYTIGSAIKRQGWGLGWATYTSARANDDVVVIAGPSFKKTIGIGLEKGDLLWALPLESPHPFFVGDDLYVMPRVGSPQTVCQKVDPLTGKVRDQFNLGVIGSCTRLTVTPTQFYFRPGGGEGRTVYVDFASRELADYEGVVRPGCFDGVVPANGRLYWTPLACDCWQVHGTFSMAPRTALAPPIAPPESTPWAAPARSRPAAADDWPMFRANPEGTATVAATVGGTAVGGKASLLWQSRLPGNSPTAPVCADGKIFVGSADGIVRALDAADGKILWQVASKAAVPHPPAYWSGRVVFGSCDGLVYCVDATTGQVLGRSELAPEKRLVNIMDRLTSAWPLGGGVVASDEGIAYTAAGSTATDGAVVAAIELATGKFRWQEAFTLERAEPKLSFGVQSNLLLKNDTLYINGGPPAGIVALDASTGGNPRVVAKLEAGMEMFLEPDDKPSTTGPELFTDQWARTTIFKTHQGRHYFRVADRHVALVAGRLFSAADPKALDHIVELMNQDPKTGKKLGGGSEPWDVMQVPVDDSILWTTDTADVRGLAVGADGVVVLHEMSVQAIAPDGQSVWTASLPAPPVRWGIALTGKYCVVTLSDGQVVCLAKGS
jgi:outer membrane protein assembly factor BamB